MFVCSFVVVPAGFPLVSSSITLLPGKAYSISIAIQATPPGTTVELMAGTWIVISDVLKEFAPSAYCSYNGTSLGLWSAGATELPGEWSVLSVTTHVPVASAAQNGTALQLRVTPPTSERGLGATVWFDNVTVVEVQ